MATEPCFSFSEMSIQGTKRVNRRVSSCNYRFTSPYVSPSHLRFAALWNVNSCMFPRTPFNFPKAAAPEGVRWVRSQGIAHHHSGKRSISPFRLGSSPKSKALVSLSVLLTSYSRVPIICRFLRTYTSFYLVILVGVLQGCEDV